MIIKVQRPLGGNDMSYLLAYNEDRSWESHIPINSQAGKEFIKLLGSREKAYFNVKVDVIDKEFLHLQKEVFTQDW